MNMFSRFLLLSLVWLFSELAFANFEFSPIVADLTTAGKGSVLLSKVTSHDSFDIPVVVRVLERSMTETGEEKRTPTTDLEVFPSQFILTAKSQRYIKVVWKGPTDLPHEKSYRILVEHLPVDLQAAKKGAASISIMTNYSGMIYVNSKPTSPRVNLVSLSQGKADRSLAVEIANDGDKHSIISKPELDVRCKDNESVSFSLGGAALKNLEGRNMLARTKLQTSISTPAGMTKCKAFTWSFRYAIQ